MPLVETCAVDPGIGVITDTLYFGLDQPVEILETGGAAEVDRRQSESPPDGVTVSVDQTGRHTGVCEVQGSYRLDTGDLVVEPDNTVTDYSDNRSDRPIRIHSDDFARPHNEIELHKRNVLVQ